MKNFMKILRVSYDDHLIFASGLARVPVPFTQRRSAFLADAASLASFSPKMSSCRKPVFQVCRDRLYVFDSGRFSWNLFLNCDTGFAFYFERELYFFLTRKTVFSKKNSPKLYFF